MKIEDVHQGQFVKFQGMPYVVVFITPEKHVAITQVQNGLCVPADLLEEHFFDHETKIERA
jgi:hypothetical protein